MKSLLVSSVVVLALSILPAGVAQASEPDFWSEVRALVMHCAVQPYAIDSQGTKVFGQLKSRCQELRRTGDGVRFMNRGQTYFARITAAPDADGMDLVDVEILDYRMRPIDTVSNVLAFGDAILALVGGEAEFQEEYDPSLIASE